MEAPPGRNRQQRACARQPSKSNCNPFQPLALLPQTPRLDASAKLADLKDADGKPGGLCASSIVALRQAEAVLPFISKCSSTATRRPAALAVNKPAVVVRDLARRARVFGPQVAGRASTLAGGCISGGQCSLACSVSAADVFVKPFASVRVALWKWSATATKRRNSGGPPSHVPTPQDVCIPGAAARSCGSSSCSRCAHAPAAGLGWQADPPHRHGRGAVSSHPIPSQLPSGSWAEGAGAFTCWLGCCSRHSLVCPLQLLQC